MPAYSVCFLFTHLGEELELLVMFSAVLFHTLSVDNMVSSSTGNMSGAPVLDLRHRHHSFTPDLAYVFSNFINSNLTSANARYLSHIVEIIEMLDSNSLRDHFCNLLLISTAQYQELCSDWLIPRQRTINDHRNSLTYQIFNNATLSQQQIQIALQNLEDGEEEIDDTFF